MVLEFDGVIRGNSGKYVNVIFKIGLPLKKSKIYVGRYVIDFKIIKIVVLMNNSR